MSHEHIGGEKPVFIPSQPAPQQQSSQPLITPKIPTLVITYQATGIVFEGSLQGDTLTHERVVELFQDVTNLANLEPVPAEDFIEDFDFLDAELDDEWSEGYEAGFIDGRSDAQVEALIESSNEPPALLFPEMFLEVGDKVLYKGECFYNKNMPTPEMVGEVVSVNDWEGELHIGVTFPGWTGGHSGDGSHGTTFYNFWFDMETGESTEGQLVKIEGDEQYEFDFGPVGH